ncbi:COG0622 Predicted phosphoesterase [uncultured Caudovirales phage]|uniref:COG0622 Predicted phosphoesterase n=1 Tax=uncultured Caudovirales phage TaxID=2100421 RepID=A0A6J5M5I0_9CAUD|nr:COG0622 Predicted phosphoesterase [uncultured Caudovirales phage]
MAKSVENRVRLSNEEQEIIREHRLRQMAERLADRSQAPKAAPTIGAGLDLLPAVSDELDLPYGHNEVELPVKLEGKVIGIISDVHVPFHDKPATEAALRWLRSQNIDTLVLNGDFMDMYQVSDHDKDKRRSITFGDELEEGRLILSQIRSYFGAGVQIVYQEGNHEERYERFLPQAMASDKVRGSSVAQQLDLHQHKIDWVGGRRGIEAGRLSIYHGHEMKASGMNAARQLNMRLMDNVIIGHLHRPQSVQRPRLKGDVIGSWVSGCLCNLRPFYAPINEWQHGFNIVRVFDDGMFNLESKLISRGQVL